MRRITEEQAIKKMRRIKKDLELINENYTETDELLKARDLVGGILEIWTEA